MEYSINLHTMDLNGDKYNCHSGHGVGLNNSSQCGLIGIGPLPPGKYTLGPWQDGHIYGPSWIRLGPLIARLYPDPSNDMMGRNDFAIHGGNGSNPPTDSDGCIIMAHNDRQALCDSGETELEVIA